MKKTNFFITTGLAAMLFAGCTSGQEQANHIGEAKAKESALAHAGISTSEVTFSKSKLEREDGREVYDVEFYTKDYKEYDYNIDASTGEVLSFDFDIESMVTPNDTPISTDNSNVSSEGITQAKAKELAIAKVSGASESDIKEFETDKDDGKTVYEGKIYYNNKEYEFEIDAQNGNFIKWEEEVF